MDTLLFKRTTKDLLRIKTTKGTKSLEAHITAAFDWLCTAQDAAGDGGVSLRYSFIKGWDSSYPETTGYIIPNFFDHAERTKNGDFFERAVRMADWELSIQKKDGSFNGGAIGSGYDSFVFDTGQILFGLIAAHRATGKEKYLDGATRAGDWLCEVQDPEGMWRKYTFNSIPHTYYTRVAWGMAELGAHTKDEKYSGAAVRNIDWALTKQTGNGWFDCAGFTEAAHSSPYTHTIAYTMEGVLGTGAVLGRKDYIEAVVKTADGLCRVIEKNRFCHGTYDRDWNSAAKYACLTGSAQIALVLLRLYEYYGTKKYLEVARSLNRFLCETQEIEKPSPARGAISGSYPIWGNYQRFAFPNWAAKFFIDSLLLENKITGA